ncbi:hypothetical protein C9C96_24605 [Salmonella enterica]|nr:hypothetical protein [Salmonella enterica]
MSQLTLDIAKLSVELIIFSLLGSGEGFITAGRWSLVAGRWSLVAGRWSLVAGRWSLVAGIALY